MAYFQRVQKLLKMREENVWENFTISKAIFITIENDLFGVTLENYAGSGSQASIARKAGMLQVSRENRENESRHDLPFTWVTSTAFSCGRDRFHAVCSYNVEVQGYCYLKKEYNRVGVIEILLIFMCCLATCLLLFFRKGIILLRKYAFTNGVELHKHFNPEWHMTWKKVSKKG